MSIIKNGTCTQSNHTAPTGNVYDKYGSRNPIVRLLVDNFQSEIVALLDSVSPSSILDVGCGEGVITEMIATRFDDTLVWGLDLKDDELFGYWRQIGVPNARFVAGSGNDLCFSNDSVDTVIALEVLEHLATPKQVLREMTLVSRQWLIVSVPREPLWRVLNVLRGAYVTNWGNTPGHVNHWSKEEIVELLGEVGRIIEVRSPLPWTIVLLSVN